MRVLPRHLAFAVLAVAFPTAGSAGAISASYPPLVSHAAVPEQFVPKGWHVWQIQKGDLNNDGVSDAVLVMERASGNAYRLAVLFGDPAGQFNLVTENNELLSSASDGNFTPYPAREGFKIRHGAFSAEMRKDGPGGQADITFTFRRQNSHFVLIGYDYLGDHRGWSKLSFNMLTGQVVETEGSDYEGNVRVVEKRKEGKFTPPKPITLDRLGNGFDFNDSFNPFKYAPMYPSP